MSTQPGHIPSFSPSCFPDGLIIINKSGEVSYSNALAQELLPQLNDAFSERWFALIHIEDQRMALACWARAIKEHGQWHTFQARVGQHEELGVLEWRISCQDDAQIMCVIRSMEGAFKELSKRKRRLRRIYEESPVMAHAIDERGKLLMVSDRWLGRLGYTKEEVIGRSSTDFLTPESKLHAKEVLKGYFRDGYCHDVEYQMVTKRGEILDVELSATAEVDEHGNFLRSFAVIIEVSEEKRLIKTLARRNALLDAFFEAIPDGAFVMDINHHIARTNHQVESLLGYDTRATQGRSLDLFLHKKEDCQRARELLFHETVQNSTPFIEVECTTAQGHTIPAHLTGAPIINSHGDVTGFLGLVRDISEQARQHQEIESQRNLMEAFFHAIPHATVIADASRRVLRTNQALSNLFGYEEAEIQGKETKFLYAQESLFARSGSKIFNTTSSQSKDVSTTRFIKQSGELFEGELIGAKIINDDAHVTGYLGLIRDMTDDLLKENQLKSRNVLLQQANKDLERFAYIASHDLQEPLRKISSFSSLLQSHLEDTLDEEGALYFHYIQDGADRMRVLIRDILAYSRADHLPELVPCSPVDIFNVSLDNYSAELDEVNARVDVIDNSEPYKALTHEAVLSQVFSNLLSNTIKYRSPERPLHITVTCEAYSQTHLRVQISDNGIGVEDRYQERIFEIFQRLHRAHDIKGQGIGLAICKKIIERQGGEFGMTSDGKSGSQFWFTLKVALS